MNQTELVFVLDRSGSMSGLESDTIGGFNSLLEKQKKEDGEAVITTVLFDDKIEVLHDRLDMKKVCKLTDKEYYVRGCTAMLDAVGLTIDRISFIHKHIRKEDLPEKVVFVIMTDGMENASKDYSYKRVKDLIEQHKEIGWEFLFLGANIDASSVGKDMGIAKDRSVSFHNDSQGIAINYGVLNETIINVRKNKTLDKSWKSKIEEDYKRR